MFLNFNVECDLFVFSKQFQFKLILYKFRIFIIKQININNVFLNDKNVKIISFSSFI